MPPLDPRQRWIEIYRRFDPERPVPMGRASWRAQRPYSPIESIIERLQLAEISGEPARLLLLGTKGTGKTTELRQLADRRAQDEFVLFLDLVQLFERVVKNPLGLYQIKPWEVYYLIGLSLYHAAIERINLPWDPEVLLALEVAWHAAAGQSAVDEPATKLDMGQLALAVFKGASLVIDGGVVLGAAADLAEKAIGAVKWDWSLPLGKARLPIDDSEPAVRRLVAAVNRIIAEVQHRHHGVLLIIDGLDRITEIEAARALFVDSQVLGEFPCNVVVCGPFILRHHPSVTSVPEFYPMPLVNEPVLQRQDPGQLGPGYAFFHELFRLRTDELPGAQSAPPLPEELLRDVAYFSGGRARDFVRLVREIAGKALLAKPAPPTAATRSMVDQVIDEARRNLEMGLYDVHINLLARVMRDPTHTLPMDDATWPMLETFRLLPYPNEHEWFYPHTLLLRRLS